MNPVSFRHAFISGNQHTYISAQSVLVMPRRLREKQFYRQSPEVQAKASNTLSTTLQEGCFSQAESASVQMQKWGG